MRSAPDSYSADLEASPLLTCLRPGYRRMLIEIEIRFRLDPKLLSPRVIYFCEVPSHSVWPAVVRAADSRKQRMELDLLIA